MSFSDGGCSLTAQVQWIIIPLKKKKNISIGRIKFICTPPFRILTENLNKRFQKIRMEKGHVSLVIDN